MKIIIEAGVNEIATLVRKLEGKQTLVSKIKFDDDSITTTVEDLVSRSEVKQEPDKIGLKIGKDRFSDSDIIEINRRMGELLKNRNIATQIEEALERRYDAEWLRKQGEYLFGTRAKAHAQEIRETERKKREAEQLKKES